MHKSGLLLTFAVILVSLTSVLCEAQVAQRLISITPCRIVDTRGADGTFGGPPIPANGTRSFPLPMGACNVPSTAAAYSLNVTVVPFGSLNYLTVWPTGQQMPLVSTLNSYDGRIKANAAIVPAGTDEAISVYATEETNVILDINGYFVPATNDGLEFFPLTPCRVADTRGANGDLGGPPLSGGVPRNFPVLEATSCNIPSSAQAYSFNFTAVPINGHPINYVTVWPTGQMQPIVSTLNVPTGTNTANAALMPAGTGGDVSVYSTDNTNLIIDIDGYFAPPGPGGLTLYPFNPCRALDTRQSGGAFDGTMQVNIADSPCLVPASAQSFVLNATVEPVGSLGYLTLWASGQMPLVSTLNASDGAVTSNMAVVPTQNGSIEAYVSDPTNLILDVTSYFAVIVPQILTTSLPEGIQGSPYSSTLQAAGGFPPYTWRVVVGSLPPGLTLTPAGVISGTPTAIGTSSFTVQATDTQHQTADANLSITVQAPSPLMITTFLLPDGTLGAPYDQTLSAAGGLPPYNWSIISGVLPAGLSLSTNGAITGTPTALGNSGFIVQVADSEVPPMTAQAELSITIDPNTPPTLNAVSPEAGALNGGAVAITVNGSGFNTGSVVQWNGNPLTTVFVDNNLLNATIPANDLQALGTDSITVYNPGTGGGTSNPEPFSVYLPMQSNDLIYNPATQLLYASVPSAGGPTYGNSIVSIDPATGALGNPIWVGSEPNTLALSSDGSTLWVGLDGAAAVREVNLVTQTAGLQFSLPGGSGLYNPPYTAAAISVMPGSPNTVAVAFKTSDFGGGAAIYDSGVQRPDTTTTNFYDLVFSSTGTEIYATGNESGYYVLTVTGSGITAANLKNDNLGATQLVYDTGKVYLSNGNELDSEQGTLLGSFYISQNQLATGPVAEDSSIGRAWILTGGIFSAPLIGAWDINTFILDGTIPVGLLNVQFGPSSLVRWGQNGLAYRQTGGIFSLTSSLVRDLSQTLADLSITAVGPASGTTGTNLTYILTINNHGPNPASPVVVTDNIPQGTVLVSATATEGSCSGGFVVDCDLGMLANNGTATVTVVVTALDPGAIENTANVSAAQGDPNLANNSVMTNTVITGETYNPAPAIGQIVPNDAQAGSSSFELVIFGLQFVPTSQVLWNGTPLPTTFVSSTQLTAQVTSSLVANPGWVFVSVSNPAPGGGTTTGLQFTIFHTISLDTNYVLFDPFTRKLYASIPSTAPQLQGNSIVSIDPVSGAIGTPVFIGSEPDQIAESDDGQWLYVLLQGSGRLARFNLVTGVADPTTYSLSLPGGGSGMPRDLTVMPGVNSTLAIDMGLSIGSGIYDISNGSGMFRSQFTGIYTGSALAMPDATHLYTYDVDTSGMEFFRWSVGANGLTAIDASTLNGLGGSGRAFKLDGYIYGSNGGLIQGAGTHPTQLGIYQLNNPNGESFLDAVTNAPEPGLDRAFFLVENFETGTPLILSYDQSRLIMLDSLSLPGVDPGPNMIRWGQDGLAFDLGLGFSQPPGSGQITLLNGAFVLSTWGMTNPTPGLSSLNPSDAQAGGGNFYLTATGTNFVPGAVLLWNGSARTTTFVDAQHLTVAIAAADIAQPGTASITVMNPGSAPSNALQFQIQASYPTDVLK